MECLGRDRAELGDSLLCTVWMGMGCCSYSCPERPLQPPAVAFAEVLTYLLVCVGVQTLRRDRACCPRQLRP